MKSIKVLLAGFCVYFLMATLHACGGHGQIDLTSSATSGGHGGAAASAAHVAAAGSGGHAGAGGAGIIPDAMADESGSRIKIMWVVGADGSKVFDGLYDSQRSESCYWSPYYDSSIRCMPLPGVGQIVATSLYSDSACTTALYGRVSPPCPTPPKYAYTSELLMCVGITSTKIFHVGQSISAPPTVYTMAGSCQLYGPAPSNYEFYELGSQIPASDFASATITTDP